MIGLIFGPPGSGKGTQAAHVEREFKLSHLSTGDILRDQLLFLVRAGFDENGSIAVGIGNHEVQIQLEGGDPADGFDDGRTHGEVRHEMSIHDVDMEHGGAAALYPLDFSG